MPIGGDIPRSDRSYLTANEILAVEAIVEFLRNACGLCELCGSDEGVNVHDAATAYHWEGDGADPNRRFRACNPCATDYYDHWNERWAEYYSSRGCG